MRGAEGLFPRTSVSIAQDGSLTLSVAQAACDLIERTTSAGAAATFTFPSIASDTAWIIRNDCKGAGTGALRLIVADRTCIVLPDSTALVTWDGAQLECRQGRLTTLSQAASANSDATVLGTPTPASWAKIAVSTATYTLSDLQTSMAFLEFHNSYVTGFSTVTFTAEPGHVWLVRCASDSVNAVRCKAAGNAATIDVNPGYDGFLIVDSTGAMTQVLVKHGNTHAAAGTDPITSLLNTSALGTGSPDATLFLRGDQTWAKAGRALTGFNHLTLSSATTTLNATQAANRNQMFTASAGGKTVVFPTTGFQGGDDWIVNNDSSFPLTIKCGAGDSGTILARNQIVWVMVDPVFGGAFIVLGAFSDGFGDLYVNGGGAFGGAVRGLENGLTYQRVGMSTATTTGTYTLTKTEYECYYIKITTALTGNLTLLFPNTNDAATWVIENLSTNAFTVTAKVASDTGAGVVVGQGKRATVSCSGTAMVRVTLDA